jgi:hypothetical protein
MPAAGMGMSRTALYRWPGLLLAVALVVLSVGVGFCLFDGHNGHGHHGTHGVSFDLCLGVALVYVATAGFTSILIHLMPLEHPLAIRALSLHAPDPPPKSRSRF